MARLLVFVAFICLPTCLYAQPGGGPPMKTGCFVDVVRDCEGMAENAIPIPGAAPMPSRPCLDFGCNELLGVPDCFYPEGLTVTNSSSGWQDVDLAGQNVPGRTNVEYLQGPISCGAVYYCSCDWGDFVCHNETKKYDYKPVEWSTFGPINCVGP